MQSVHDAINDPRTAEDHRPPIMSPSLGGALTRTNGKSGSPSSFGPAGDTIEVRGQPDTASPLVGNQNRGGFGLKSNPDRGNRGALRQRDTCASPGGR